MSVLDDLQDVFTYKLSRLAVEFIKKGNDSIRKNLPSIQSRIQYDTNDKGSLILFFPLPLTPSFAVTSALDDLVFLVSVTDVKSDV